MIRQFGLFLVAVVLGAALFWMAGGGGPGQKTASTHDVAAEVAGVAPETAPDPGASPRQRLRMSSRREQPREPELSLQGTEVGGGFAVDAAGNFVATTNAIAVFEYFLSTTGELSPEEILRRIQAEIGKRLGPPADAQATEFLGRYMSYRDRARALGAGHSEEAGLRERFQRVRDLRREMFGEEVADRLFGQEDAAAEIAITQREIAEDPSLSDQEKAARIAELYDDLPEPMRKAREESMAAIKLRQDEEKMRRDGADEEQIRRMRVERFGEEAADRLDALDREDAEWSSRLLAFRQERQRIRSDSSLTAEQREGAVARLMEELFDERERIRVLALDEIGE